MRIFQSEYISCKPISNLEDLLNWPALKAKSRHYKTEKLPPSPLIGNADSAVSTVTTATNKPKLLVCHDMKNNYLEDRYFQGSDKPDCYTFCHWNLVDAFVYFSHHLVTIPPESWINAAHENGTPILGTFITEFGPGEQICQSLFKNLDLIIEILIDITVFFGFDGWLVNIENKIATDVVHKLKYFLQKLNNELKRVNRSFLLVWYDSVCESGELKWQNELNEANRAFFDLTDGIFLNYTWTEENLQKTAVNATQYRRHDVFVGVDVFGRGCLGDGGFNCRLPFDLITRQDLSIALFAPGWVHECLDTAQFKVNNETFWSLLKPYLSRRAVRRLPLVTSFTHGCGHLFFVHGKSYPNSKWNNFNLQSLLPVLDNGQTDGGSGGGGAAADWCFEDAFYGGNCLLFKPNIEALTLFELSIHLKFDENLTVEYIFKVFFNMACFKIGLFCFLVLIN
jgi:mannosyl-glycoprotein endo-beta-N-acetylglucosaminidase